MTNLRRTKTPLARMALNPNTGFRQPSRDFTPVPRRVPTLTPRRTNVPTPCLTPMAENGADTCLARYWRSNVKLTLVLLFLWAVLGLGSGSLWADELNRYHLPGTGYPLGFWFAHQGSIVGFVFLILAYATGMNYLDARHKAEVAANMAAMREATAGESERP